MFGKPVKKSFILKCVIMLVFLAVPFVYGEAGHAVGVEQEGFKVMGIDFGVLSGVLTITSLFVTFIIGMLRHFGKRKFNRKYHHYAAYTTVIAAAVHAVYNLITHS